MNRSVFLILALVLALPAHAKTISGETAARVSEILASCVQAIRDRSNEVFKGWDAQDGFVPVAYLFEERWISPQNDARVFFGQRSDKPGQPHICVGELLREEGNRADNARDAYALVEWVKTLPDTILAGIPFSRSDRFERAQNAAVLSACVDGHRMILDARVAPNGSALFGAMVPYGEVLKC